MDEVGRLGVGSGVVAGFPGRAADGERAVAHDAADTTDTAEFAPDTGRRGGAVAVPGSSLVPAGGGSVYAELSRLVLAAGLLAKRRGYYRVRIGVVLGLWVAGWMGFALLGRSWWQLLVAGFLAVVFAQVGFLGHDAGHRQVFAARRGNDRLGLLCANLLIGLSYGWWIDKHNRHHAHPNEVGRDPDIAGAGLAFTPAQARARRSGAGRWLARHQAAMFFPMLLLEGLDLHVSSVRAVASTLCGRRDRSSSRRGGRAWWVESVLLTAHFVGYLGAVFLVLPVGQAVAFIAVHQGLLGVYLGCSFAPSHKGMPRPGPGERWDFLRRQVLTSRNVTGGRWLDVAMGGLNYQIEHHLFPSMPSPTLRAAQPVVRAFCLRHQLPYYETTLTDSYAQVLGYLRGVGAAARPRRTVQPEES